MPDTPKGNVIVSHADRAGLMRLLAPPAVDISRGLVNGVSVVQKFGRNTALPNGGTTWAAIAQSGIVAYLQTASTMRVKAGGNAADTVAGLGARKVMIVGLDENWDRAEEEVDLAGASASAVTTTTFIRVFRAYVTEVGAYGVANTGAITIEVGGGGTDVAVIPAGEGQTQMCVFTIPAGYVGLIRRATAEVASTKTADLRLRARTNTADPTTAPFGPWRTIGFRDLISGQVTERYEFSEQLPPKTDIAMEGIGNGASVQATGELEIVLVPIAA